MPKPIAAAAKVLRFKRAETEAMAQRIIVVNRDVPARLVPTGNKITIPKNAFVNITQALGGTYTVTHNGNMARIDGTDADALGLEPEELNFEPPAGDEVSEDQVWEALSTIYDPEIPVSIVDLGLVYEVSLSKSGDDNVVEVTMTLTAPGCGMGEVLVGDVEYRVSKVPNVDKVNVELVFDPPWSREMISDEGKLELGIF